MTGSGAAVTWLDLWARNSGRLVDEINKPGEEVRWRVGEYPVAQVEDVPGAAIRSSENTGGRLLYRRERRQQNRGLKIPLQPPIEADSPPRLVESDPPIDADDVASFIREVREELERDAPG